MYIEIAKAVRDLQMRVWNQRDSLLPADYDLVDLFCPSIAAKVLGFQYEEVPEIPNWPHIRNMRIAGLVDPQQKLIQISEQFELPVRRFTGAHEIGHVVLHPLQGLRRERPVAGPSRHSGQQSTEERQADIFASLYLMPERLLRKRVYETFNMKPPIAINDAIAFWLDPNDHQEMLREPSESHTTARNFAKCNTNFNGQQIVPLFEQFKVSISAMAYRIEELHLLQD